MALLDSASSSLYSTTISGCRHDCEHVPSIFSIQPRSTRKHRRSVTNCAPLTVGGFGPLPSFKDRQKSSSRPTMRRVGSNSTLTAPSSSSSSNRSSIESNSLSRAERSFRSSSTITENTMKRLDFEAVAENVVRPTSTVSRRHSARYEPMQLANEQGSLRRTSAVLRRNSARTEPLNVGSGRVVRRTSTISRHQFMRNDSMEYTGRLSTSTSSVSRRSSSSKFEMITERVARRNSGKIIRNHDPFAEIEPVTEPEPEPESDLERHRPPVQVCGQASCAIEKDLFRNGDTVARLPCGHVFHRDCIQPFIFHNRNGGYCPLDGTPVPRERATLLPVWRVTHSSCTSPKRPVQPPPMEPPVLDLTPRESEVTLKKWAPQFRETCAIDGARFRQGEMCVRIKRCGHVFHARCVSEQIAAGEFKRCPIDGEKITPNNLRNCVVDTLSGENRGSLREIAAAMNSSRTAGVGLNNAKKFDSGKREAKVRRALRSFRRSANFVSPSQPPPIHECASSESSSHNSVNAGLRRRSQANSIEEPRHSASTVFMRRNRMYIEGRRLSRRHDSL